MAKHSSVCTVYFRSSARHIISDEPVNCAVQNHDFSYSNIKASDRYNISSPNSHIYTPIVALKIVGK